MRSPGRGRMVRVCLHTELPAELEASGQQQSRWLTLEQFEALPLPEALRVLRRSAEDLARGFRAVAQAWASVAGEDP